MVSDRVEVDAVVTMDMTELQKAEAEADRVMSKMQRVITFVQANARKIAMSAIGAMSIMSNVIRATGMIMTPVQNALVELVEVVVSSVVQMHSILAAGTGGLSLALTGAMMVAAIGISAYTLGQTTRGFNSINSQLRAAQSAAQSTLSLIRFWS